MLFVSAGIVFVSSFAPMATLVVNATPGAQIQIVAEMGKDKYVPAVSFPSSYTATSAPRRISVQVPKDATALCAQIVPPAPKPGYTSLVLRSCSRRLLPERSQSWGTLGIWKAHL